MERSILVRPMRGLRVVHGPNRVLNLVTPVPPDLREARELLRIVELSRYSMWTVAIIALVVLAVTSLMVAAYPLAGLSIGAAVSLSLCRYGPSWWPGRR